MRWLVFLLLAMQPAAAETVIAAGTIRGQQLIGPMDVALAEGTTPGALSELSQAIGMEARVNLYPGRPIRAGDLRPPAIVERNAIITLRYDAGGLLIVTEGRALDRAARGEALRVLNLSSRNTVTAVAAAPGLAIVGPLP
ncbi:Flagellar basal-body P-ring formation protein FlgA [Roseibacterium elongatum DSM 19469]|uniref:Flagella basal body P-ring formation protein FlgA n=1 Tax=Roseicyclus elongatus DSM 19469 TaxID=1294273 RepID=W8SMD9_9RHOB|nr:flagellar basal body P-ring formation chaperone FlgA [Roseibacterium elongatum]AHM03710.1 Flagellar basal-body P-ring formation protein FlgA [Roseibacterium elongatum DSM 19469]